MSIDLRWNDAAVERVSIGAPRLRCVGLAAMMLGALVGCDGGATGDAVSPTAGDNAAVTAAGAPEVWPFAPVPQPVEIAPDVLSSSEVWHQEVLGCGVSSPRALHVNDDGVLDVIFGVGREFQWGAIVALSGADGSELWRHEIADESYATPCLIDVDGDGDLDVVSGR
ncbi:MAG: hypothetical protein ACI9EF_002649, partial [Pseudohongiellaceae bacterium]